MAERPPLPFSSPEHASSATPFGSPLEPVAAPRQLKPPPGDTYVVKVQKDQIYRVPPPENAYLAERYRTERAGGGKRGGGDSACSPCLMLTVGLAVAAALLLGAGIALTVVVLRPDPPSFAVDRLSVHNASAQHHVDYDFFLTAINPNKVTALWYKGGKAELLHGGTPLAKGEVGRPEDGGEDATDFNVLLHGVGHAPPKAVEKALSSGAKKGTAVALELTVDVPVQVHVGALGFGTRRLVVACDIRTASLRKDVRISSQNCKSRLGNWLAG